MNQDVRVHQEQESRFSRRERMHKLIQRVGLSAFTEIGNTSAKSIAERVFAGLMPKNFGHDLRRLISATVGHTNDFTSLAQLVQM